MGRAGFARPPAHLLVVLELTSWYSPEPVRSEDGVHEGGTLCCSLLLARQLSESQYCALVVSQLSLGQVAPAWWKRYWSETKPPGPTLATSGWERGPLRPGPTTGGETLQVWQEIWQPLEKAAGLELLWAALQPAARLAGRERAFTVFLLTCLFQLRWPQFIAQVYRGLRQGRICSGGESGVRPRLL